MYLKLCNIELRYSYNHRFPYRNCSGCRHFSPSIPEMPGNPLQKSPGLSHTASSKSPKPSPTFPATPTSNPNTSLKRCSIGYGYNYNNFNDFISKCGKIVKKDMDRAKNPFTPGAGSQPPELAGREENIERARIVLERIKNGRQDRSVILYGLRGVGKTVLLNKISNLADSTGYYSLLIESPEDKPLAQLLVPPLRQILLKIDQAEGAKEKVRQAFAALRSFASVFEVKIGELEVGVKAAPGTADSGYLENDLSDLFVSIGEAAAEAKTAIAVMVDELQYVKDQELGALISAIHRVSQKNLPFVVFGAGLPQIARLTGTAKSYAERLFEFKEIGALNNEDAIEAIFLPLRNEGVEIEKGALNKVLELTEGYPYFIQEWGAHIWNIAPRSPISKRDVLAASDGVIKTLDQGFFKVRFDRLTPGEKDYIRAMAELGPGPHRSSDIASKLGRPIEQLAPMRAKIISKGMIYSPHHGDTAFTVPKFDEYLKRAIPDFSQKQKR